MLLFLFTTLSCSYKPDRSTIATNPSQQLCACFSKQKAGTIDEMITPCINTIATAYGHSKVNLIVPYGVDSTSIKLKTDSINRENLRFTSAVINEAVVSCDRLGIELESMYDKWYPLDSSASNLTIIRQLSNELSKTSIADTAYKRLLHALISRNIKARQLNLALQNCQKMKGFFPTEEGAYFASAFIYNLQQKYPLATAEIQQEMMIGNSNDLKLILAIIERKSNYAKAHKH